MKKVKIGTTEILGCTGLLLWCMVVFLRSIHLPGNEAYQFVTGILPNLGAAWAATLFGKWLFIFVCKQSMTYKKHIILCLGILGIALASEVGYALFTSRLFDWCDIIATIAAQLIMILLPILTKDRYFSNYN